MEKIDHVVVSPCNHSKYIIPFKINYTQDDVPKVWDTLKAMDSVAIFIYNKSSNCSIFVKQFRPSVYLSRVEIGSDGKVDTEKYPASLGVTYELCAGLIDKNKSPQETAQAEILEECGFKVALDTIEKIGTYRDATGMSGYLVTLFYVEVTNKMRVSKGGGAPEEGELIEVCEMPVNKVKDILDDDDIAKPGGFMYTILWFLSNKYDKYNK